jgi:hypothetical protein
MIQELPERAGAEGYRLTSANIFGGFDLGIADLGKELNLIKVTCLGKEFNLMGKEFNLMTSASPIWVKNFILSR